MGERVSVDMKVTHYVKVKEIFQFHVHLSTKEDIDIVDVQIKKRNDKESYNLPFKLVDPYKMHIEFELIPDSIPFTPGYWDLYINVKSKKGLVKAFRIKNPKRMVAKKIDSRLDIGWEEDGFLLYPYVTVKSGISFQYRKKGPHDYPVSVYKEILAYIFYSLTKLYWNKRQIILINEKFSKTAQDNSFYFFKYCQDNRISKDYYYVIEKNSKDLKYLQGYMSNVIYFMSIKHLVYTLACKFFISSESRTHAYIWKEHRGLFKRIINEKKHVFLQHGVLGLKQVDNIFKKNSVNGTDLFITSSEFEKSLVEQYFNYEDHEVVVTGLSRWDYLKRKKGDQQYILIIPTWRKDLDETTIDDFISSSFYGQYKRLLTNKKLLDLLKRNNLKLKFILHPKLHAFTSTFELHEDANVELMDFGESPLNELIMHSSMLITDYSSVAWDAFYIKIPVVFYRFDNEITGYLSNDQLFGALCNDESEVVDEINYYIDNNFKEKEEYAIKRKRYFKYMDNKNAERILNEITLRENSLK